MSNFTKQLLWVKIIIILLKLTNVSTEQYNSFIIQWILPSDSSFSPLLSWMSITPLIKGFMSIASIYIFGLDISPKAQRVWMNCCCLWPRILHYNNTICTKNSGVTILEGFQQKYNSVFELLIKNSYYMLWKLLKYIYLITGILL